MFGFRGQAKPPTRQTIGQLAQSVIGLHARESRSRGSLTMMVRQENGTANVGKSTSGFCEDLNESQALEIAKQNQNCDIDPAVTTFLRPSIDGIWDRV